MPDIIPTRQSRVTGRQTLTRLLAQRTGDVIVGPAIVRLSRPAGDQHFGRAGFRRIGRQALALLVALGLAEFVGTRLAVGRAVGRRPGRSCAPIPSRTAWPAATGCRKHPWPHPWRARSDSRCSPACPSGSGSWSEHLADFVESAPDLPRAPADGGRLAAAAARLRPAPGRRAMAAARPPAATPRRPRSPISATRWPRWRGAVSAAR